MNSRSKGFLLTLFVLSLGIASYYGVPEEPEPYEFTDQHVLNAGRLEIAYLSPEFEQAAKTLKSFLQAPINDFEEVIPLEEGFKVRVSLDPGLEPAEFWTSYGNRIDGIAITANFASKADWDPGYFGSYIFHQVLSALTDSRGMHEPQHWLLDGFSTWWVTKNEASEIDRERLRALYAMSTTSFSEKFLMEWDTTADRIGEDSAMSAAYTAWDHLAQKVGVEKLFEFARQEFSRPTHGDARDWWQEFNNPFIARFESATGLRWKDFLTSWVAQLQRQRSQADYAKALNDIPKGNFSVDVYIDELGVGVIEYDLQFDRKVSDQTACKALHRQIGVYDGLLGRAGMFSEDLSPSNFVHIENSTSVQYQLRGQYSSGSRVLVGMECQLAPFPSPQFLGGYRVTLQ